MQASLSSYRPTPSGGHPRIESLSSDVTLGSEVTRVTCVPICFFLGFLILMVSVSCVANNYLSKFWDVLPPPGSNCLFIQPRHPLAISSSATPPPSRRPRNPYHTLDISTEYGRFPCTSTPRLPRISTRTAGNVAPSSLLIRVS